MDLDHIMVTWSQGQHKIDICFIKMFSAPPIKV